jgi:excisionase family DNA binding protein
MTTAIENLPLLASPKMAAEVMGLTESQVRYLLHEGRLRYVRIGKRAMIPRDAIEAFIAENTVQPTSQGETKALGSFSAPNAAATTSAGQRAVAAGSAARALQISSKLKFSSPSSSTNKSAPPAPVIPLKS